MELSGSLLFRTDDDKGRDSSWARARASGSESNVIALIIKPTVDSLVMAGLPDGLFHN